MDPDLIEVLKVGGYIITILVGLITVFVRVNGSVDKKIKAALAAYKEEVQVLKEVEATNLDLRFKNSEGKLKSIAMTNSLMAGRYREISETQVFKRTDTDNEE